MHLYVNGFALAQFVNSLLGEDAEVVYAPGFVSGFDGSFDVFVLNIRKIGGIGETDFNLVESCRPVAPLVTVCISEVNAVRESDVSVGSARNAAVVAAMADVCFCYI